MKKDKLREYFSIPNILSYFRLILIPVYLVVYFMADEPGDYLWAALVIAISGLTDMFDGKIARHFNMITEWGKLIDPVADKLTMASVALSLAFRFPLMRLVFALYVVKEGFMAIMGLIMLRRGFRMDGAMWYGKVCTAITYAVVFLLLLVPGMAPWFQAALISLQIVVTLFSFIMYAIYYHKVWKQMKKNKGPVV